MRCPERVRCCCTLLGASGLWCWVVPVGAVWGFSSGRPRDCGTEGWTGCSRSMCAGLSLSTVIVSGFPPLSILNLFKPGCNTLKGPS